MNWFILYYVSRPRALWVWIWRWEWEEGCRRYSWICSKSLYALLYCSSSTPAPSLVFYFGHTLFHFTLLFQVSLHTRLNNARAHCSLFHVSRCLSLTCLLFLKLNSVCFTDTELPKASIYYGKAWRISPPSSIFAVIIEQGRCPASSSLLEAI